MSKRRGMTVMETLVAATVFALAILTVLGMFSLSFRYTQHSRNITAAAQLAQETVDAIRLAGFDNATLNANPPAVATSKLPGGYTKTYVTHYNGNDKIKQITIRVYWQNRPESEAITLVTLLGQGGIAG